MKAEDLGQWRKLSEEVMSGMTEWRKQHPKATMRQIETELDTRLARLRAQMLTDVAVDSAATEWAEAPEGAQPVCPECGAVLEERGTKTRSLQTGGGQAVHLTRQYGVCPQCGAGIFPPG